MSVTLRDAATVMLIRDADDEEGRPAIEVCMLRRNLASEFVAGAYVFPGGSVDPEDRGPGPRRCARDAPTPRPAPSWASTPAAWPFGWRRCGSASRRPASWWPARPATDPSRGDLLDTTDPAVAGRFAVHRDAVNEAAHRAPRRLRPGGPGAGSRRRPLRQPLDHPELAPRRTTPGSSSPPPRRARSPATTTGRPSPTSGSVRPRRWPGRQPVRSSCCPRPSPTCATSRPTGRRARSWSGPARSPRCRPCCPSSSSRTVTCSSCGPATSGYEEALADRLASGPEVDPGLADVARSIWGPKAGTA